MPAGASRSTGACKRLCCQLTCNQRRRFFPRLVQLRTWCVRASSNFHGVDAAANRLFSFTLR